MSINIQLLTLDGMELSKSTIEVQADNIIANVIDGFDSALELDVKLKYVEETIKLARGKIKENVQKESDKGVNSYQGCTVSKKKGSYRLDYSKDKVYSDIEKELEERKKLLDQAYNSTAILVINDGEIVPKVPVKTWVADSISYTFKK